jgi:hypothetical protein
MAFDESGPSFLDLQLFSPYAFFFCTLLSPSALTCAVPNVSYLSFYLSLTQNQFLCTGNVIEQMKLPFADFDSLFFYFYARGSGLRLSTQTGLAQILLPIIRVPAPIIHQYKSFSKCFFFFFSDDTVSFNDVEITYNGLVLSHSHQHGWLFRTLKFEHKQTLKMGQLSPKSSANKSVVSYLILKERGLSA